jgi:hypothetical protein
MARQQWAEDEDRRPHRLDHVVRGERIVEVATVEHDIRKSLARDLDAHLLDQAQHRRHVPQLRHVAQMQRSALSRLAQRIGRAAFLAPEMAISPDEPPAALDQQLIHAALLHSSGVCVFIDSACKLAAVEMLLQDLVDQLLALHAAPADKALADDQRLEVVAIAADLQVFAGQAVGDQLVDSFRVHHGSGPQFVAASSSSSVAADTSSETRADDRQAGFRRHVRDAEEAVAKTVDHIEHRIEMRYLLPEVGE